MDLNALFGKIEEQSQMVKNSYDKAFAELQKERELVEKDKKLFVDMSEKIEKVHFKDVITLNIGGQHFTTSLTTLQADKDSFFSKMFSGNWKLESLPDGSFFIDRDGTNFRYLLNFLRTGKVSFPDDEFLTNELVEEATYYNLQGFLSHFEKQRESSLLSKENQTTINSWVGGTNLKWQLIYRATRDGFEAQKFHSLCDGQTPTLTVIQSSEGYKFGGYTTAAWSSSSTYQIDSSAFLFTLTNPYALPPTKYPITNPQNAIYCQPSYGPTFGSGHDLHICSNANGNPNTTIQHRSRAIRSESYSNLPHGYADSTGKGNLTFTGNRNFTVSEIEVFKRL